MNKFLLSAVFATLVTFSLVPVAVEAREETAVEQSVPSAPAAPARIVAGKPLYSASGGKIGAIYKVNDGQAQLILDGKLISLPVASLSEVEGRIVTPLTRRELKAR